MLSPESCLLGGGGGGEIVTQHLINTSKQKLNTTNIITYPYPCRHHRRTFRTSIQTCRNQICALTAPISVPNHLKNVKTYTSLKSALLECVGEF